MLRVASVVRKPAVKAELIADTVTLDYEARRQQALTLYGEGGLTAEFSSDKAVILNDGDAFKLEDGRLLVVKAAPEWLLKITSENPLRLTRLAWQLGSRHAALEADAAALYVENLPELEELARGQGCLAEAVERPFSPEQAADDHECCHGHEHGHGHHHGKGGCGCGRHGHHHGHDHDQGGKKHEH